MSETYSRLQLVGLPDIRNLEDLSEQTHLSKGLLYKLSKCNNLHYKRFDIPKRGGKTRRITSPSREMKAVQVWILRNILDKISVSNAATAFRKNKGILVNAENHKHDRYYNNKYFLCLDIEDFFPSITAERIFKVFKTLGYKDFVSKILTSFCTCDGTLPQGGVTSPALSNIVCTLLDRRIIGYVGKKNVAYSRYADDMTFSCMSPNRLIGVKRFVQKIVEDEGFKLNEDKTRFLGPKKQRKITGLIVSDDRIGVGLKTKRLLRAKIHRLYTRNMPEAERQALLLHIRGWICFIEDVDRKTYDHLQRYLLKFNASEQYSLQL